MTTRIIIDGYNFLWQDGLFRDQAIRGFDKGREKLLDWMKGLPRLEGFDVTVVFDAYKTDAPHPTQESFHGLKVVYTARGQKADDLIREMASYHGPSAVIVSSDREVTRFADKKGCGVLGAGEFRSAITRPETFEIDPSRKPPRAKRRALAKLLRNGSDEE